MSNAQYTNVKRVKQTYDDKHNTKHWLICTEKELKMISNSGRSQNLKTASYKTIYLVYTAISPAQRFRVKCL